MIACSTGDACGLTDTRSSRCSWSNHSAVMIDTIDALEAWWPPTFRPDGLGRTRLAWSTIAVGQPQHPLLDRAERAGTAVAGLRRRAPLCVRDARHVGASLGHR